MKRLVAGIGQCLVATGPDCQILAPSLGSCIGLLIYEPGTRVGGVLHCLLPDSTFDPEKAARNPALFADSGAALLISEMQRAGAALSAMQAFVIGGAALVEDTSMFNIGKRNQLAVRKALWKAGLIVQAEDVGGQSSRTAQLSLSDGIVSVRSAAGERFLYPKCRSYSVASGAHASNSFSKKRATS